MPACVSIRSTGCVAVAGSALLHTAGLLIWLDARVIFIQENCDVL